MRRQATQAIGPSRFLGQSCERQRHARAADKRHEIAPLHSILIDANLRRRCRVSSLEGRRTQWMQMLARRNGACPLRVTPGITRTEHNESALARAADIRADVAQGL